MKCKTKKSVTRVLLTMFSFGVLASFGFADVNAQNGSDSILTDVESVSLQEEVSAFTNPERGWYKSYETNDLYGFAQLKNNGITVVLLEADIGDYKDGPIGEEKLNEIRTAFQKARDYNLTVVFRAGYDFTGKENCEPEDINIVLNHISQLGAIFSENEDILYSVQAGFIGPWGEWHSSIYGSPISDSVQQQVVDALLDVLPDNVTIQLRRPMYIRGIAGEEPASEIDWENGSKVARIGYHNDAFLSTYNDYGTYVDSAYDREAELSWLEKHARFTPVMAETNYLSSLSDSDNAIYEMEKTHLQLLNVDYHPDVITKWKENSYDGMLTYDYIGAHLGYRFAISEVGFNQDVQQGSFMHLNLTLENKGFGNLMINKDFDLILEKDGQTYCVPIQEDVRKWYVENGEMNKDFYFSIPNDMQSGDWNVYLSISSPYASLKDNAAYSIRFANSDMWDEDTGYNYLGIVTVNESKGSSNIISELKEISREEAGKLIATDTAAVSTFSISNDQENLYIEVSGNGLSGKSQFFISTNNDTGNGMDYIWPESAFDYLIEDDHLYYYQGLNNQWSWKKISDVELYNDDQNISIKVPLQLLNIVENDVIEIAFISNDDYSVTYPSTKEKSFNYTVK